MGGEATSTRLFYRAFLACANLIRRARVALRRREIDRFRRHCLNWSKLVPEAVFVVVGANDGVTGDPCLDILLANPIWKGLLIEPVPHCFERLRRRFSDASRFVLERVAIGERPGRAPFYYVDPAAVKALPALPAWHDGLGSLERTHILKHLNGMLEPFIVECEVEVCTLSEVLARTGIHDVHLLQIDTEGHDLQVLKTVDFAIYVPAMIFVEHKHLPREGKAAMRRLLLDHGYSVRDCGADYYARNEGASKRLQTVRASLPRVIESVYDV